MADLDPQIDKPEVILRGALAERVIGRVDGEAYETVDQVVEEALAALGQRDDAWNAMVKEKIAEALADPRPGVPMEEAFARLRQRIEKRRSA